MDNPYESTALLHQYLLFHYGKDDEILPWAFGPADALGFPVRCAAHLIEAVGGAASVSQARALDLGCAVGRTSFELARHCPEVIGIDFSASFIAAASQLAAGESLPYTIRETGTRTRLAIAKAPRLPNAHQLHFETGDAQNLRTDLGKFDLLTACNLLCRLPRPQLFLQRLPDLLNPGAHLLLTTPNTWLEEFTAPDFWIGATPETGEPFEALHRILQPHFRLISRTDIPFLIREHYRKYQWSIAEATVWQRLS